MSLYQEAFGNDFNLGIELPSSFIDQSYKNDVCPCFVCRYSESRVFYLWVDFDVKAERENPDSKRYTLELETHNSNQRQSIIETDSALAIYSTLVKLGLA